MSASANLAVHEAVLVKLKAANSLSILLADDPLAGSPSQPSIFDYVPQPDLPEDDLDFPYVVVGDSTSVQADTDDVHGQETTITIHVFDRNNGSARIKQITDEIYSALHDQSLTVTGFTSVFCFWEFSESVPEPEPLTEHGVTRFRIFTQA